MDTRVVLLAEDDDDDIFLIKLAFKEAQIPNRLQVVRDGEEAVAYLMGEGQYANRAQYPLPTLLLLDVKMPRRNGFEVLQWIRSEPTLRALRVIVLTTSTEPARAREAYLLGANAFLVKPAEFRSLVNLFKALDSYWLRLDQSPDITSPKKKPRHRISRNSQPAV
jgi:CheY-like chemotaxis protein